MSIAKRIQRAREAAGLNQTGLAEKLGITPQSVQQWEKGETTPRGSRLDMLSKILGKSKEWIQFGAPEFSETGILLPVIEIEDTIDYKAATEDAKKYMPYWRDKASESSFGIENKTRYQSGLSPGDMYVVDPEKKPKHNDLIVVIFDGSPILSRLTGEGKNKYLNSVDNTTPQIPFPSGSEIVGTVIGIHQPRSN